MTMMMEITMATIGPVDERIWTYEIYLPLSFDWREPV